MRMIVIVLDAEPLAAGGASLPARDTVLRTLASQLRDRVDEFVPTYNVSGTTRTPFTTDTPCLASRAH